jgi:tRNA(Ile2) C34 agmatinyltransferase TiaS
MQAWALERGVEVVPHGLRKNAVNALLEAECSTAEVSAITGQSLKMVEHYAKKRNQKRLGGSAILKFDAARQRRAKK